MAKDGEVVSLQDAIDDARETPRIPTGIVGVDFVLGGGFVQNSITLLCGDPGAGKCLGRGTQVLRFDGRIVAVEEIKQGDVLMGPDSAPRAVLSTTSGSSPMYKIVPTKGEPWTCNDKHVLTLVDSGRDTIFDMPLDVYLRDTSSRKVRWKLFQPPTVNFSEQYGPETRPVSPYFLGIWLGDGTKELRKVGQFSGELAKIQITKPDAEIEVACRDEAAKFGLHVLITTNDSGCPSFNIAGEKSGGKPGSNPLLNTMRDLMRNGLRVPESYRYAPHEIRAEVLAGLLDTDGYYSKGYYEIVQKNSSIADDVAFLARSLGLRVTRQIKTVDNSPYHRLCISGDATHIPLRIPRKQPKPRKQIKNALRTGFAVEPLGDGEYFGFTLDGDGRFLLGDFTVTHNSTLALQIFREMALKRNTALYVTGEQTVNDVALRAKSFGTFPKRMNVVRETDLDAILDILEDRRPAIAAIDSLQTIEVDDDLAIGSTESIRIAVRELTQLAKEHNIAIVFVGHVTKDGALSGPRALEHLVDVHLHLAVRFTDKVRTLKCEAKNRYGEVPRRSLFKMTNEGLVEYDETEAPPASQPTPPPQS